MNFPFCIEVFRSPFRWNHLQLLLPIQHNQDATLPPVRSTETPTAEACIVERRTADAHSRTMDAHDFTPLTDVRAGRQIACLVPVKQQVKPLFNASQEMARLDKKLPNIRYKYLPISRVFFEFG